MPGASAPLAKDQLQQARKSLKMPDVRSVLLLQSQLMEGHWKRRHLDALTKDERARMALIAVLECTSALQGAELDADSHRQSRQKNLLCLARNLCPEEATRWATCVQTAATALRASNMPPENCERYRRRLEECTQAQTSLLLRTALLPPSPEWGGR